MPQSENALKEFRTEHAEGIAATKAEFVKFLREGKLPDEELDLVALYIYISNRAMLKHDPKRTPVPAGNFFASVVEDGVYDSIEHWDNPKKYAALAICPECDGEGYTPKAGVPKLKQKTSGRRGRVAAVRGV